MPQAIERLLATPMMSPRLPCIRVPAGISFAAPGALMLSVPRLFPSCGRLVGELAASYTISPAGLGRLGLHELGQQAGQLLRLSLGQVRAEVLLDGPDIDRPHGPAQRSPLGGDDEHIVAAIESALVTLDQTFALQPVDQTANIVLRQLRAVLHAGLAQHALGRAVDLMENVIPVER